MGAGQELFSTNCGVVPVLQARFPHGTEWASQLLLLLHWATHGDNFHISDPMLT